MAAEPKSSTRNATYFHLMPDLDFLPVRGRAGPSASESSSLDESYLRGSRVAAASRVSGGAAAPSLCDVSATRSIATPARRRRARPLEHRNDARGLSCADAPSRRRGGLALGAGSGGGDRCDQIADRPLAVLSHYVATHAPTRRGGDAAARRQCADVCTSLRVRFRSLDGRRPRGAARGLLLRLHLLVACAGSFRHLAAVQLAFGHGLWSLL